MFKKIEKIIFQRNPSFTSVSTASSTNSGSSKTTQPTNSIPLSKNPSGLTQNPTIHFPSPPLDQIVMDIKLNKINSRNLSNFSGGDEITSNLACDGYQGLFAIAYKTGKIEIFDLMGDKRINIQCNSCDAAVSNYVGVITSIKFFPNRPYLLTLNSINQIHLVNY